MNERELIRELAAQLPSNPNLVLGAGDDCAALRLPPGADILLLKTDAVVEGVHFEPGAPGRSVGHKALARCLSDVAAMGGAPESALVTLGLPGPEAAPRATEAYQGLCDLARRYRISVSGGETTRSPSLFFLSVAVLGYAHSGGEIRRSGALPGDALLVTGRLGGSLQGRHLDFEPRIEEGLWLAEHFRPRAMIDLSDGLGRDLPLLLEESGVGATLDERCIPVSPQAGRPRRPGSSGSPPLQAALGDGEDYELLFALEARLAAPLKARWAERFPQVPLSVIGKVEPEPGLRLRTRTGTLALQAHGFDHFPQP